MTASLPPLCFFWISFDVLPIFSGTQGRNIEKQPPDTYPFGLTRALTAMIHHLELDS
jgi:hypothetical protein